MTKPLAPLARRQAPADRRLVAGFATMCLIWGLTWVPIRVGVAALPPLFFGGTRGLAAGGLLLALASRQRRPAIERCDYTRLFVVALLANGLTYGLLFWGMTRVDSGLAAVVNMSLIPLSLLLIAVALGEERLSRSKIAATLLGIVGLTLMSLGALSANYGADWSLGLAAVALSSVAYALGSVLSRELLRRHSPFSIAGWVQLLGGGMLLVLWAAQPRSTISELGPITQPRVLLSWTYLVLFGSVIAYSLYLTLTRDWSPSIAGQYAFVSPAIAMLSGVVLLRESMTAREGLGMVALLASTVLALRRRREGDPDAT